MSSGTQPFDSVRGELASYADTLVEVGTVVTARLAAAFPTLPEAAIEDAVSDAIIELWRRTHASGECGSAQSLYSSAWRNAANTVRSERARKRREAEWFLNIARTPDATRDDGAAVRICAKIMEALPDARMRALFALRLEGVKSATKVAEALGIAGLSSEAQRRAVKREADRLSKFLRRAARVRRILGEAAEVD